MSKVVKDPIYGYVEIDENIMNDIVDTECFQRLRNIIQTSYSPLYHSAIHNRFTHSIGVYFLGKKVINSSKIVFREFVKDEEVNELKDIFLLSCLLHDVGHAPFSHTGEEFFLNDIDERTGRPQIHTLLIDVVNNDEFAEDVKFYSSAKPHEIMSVIVGINNFSNYINSETKRDFFARCITGYKYRNIKDNKSFLNCLIELLNSNLIDVDKLDYIIRDAFTTGFQSVSIDFNRLLEAVCIVKDDKDLCKLAYHKSALSVIENVVYAHDAERKWIQNHPIVLYENLLIQHAIRKVDKYYTLNGAANRLFSYQTISAEGNDFSEKGKIRLLSDGDIIYNIKNVCGDGFTDEYFSRNMRRHPIWKSESEYRALFDRRIVDDELDILEESFSRIESHLRKLELPIINDKFIDFCDVEINKLRESKDIGTQNLETALKGFNTIKKWAECLKKFAEENKIPFDFVTISTKKFKSGFLKSDIENLLIRFPKFNKSTEITKISSILNFKPTRENFFYIFYKRIDDEIDINKFANAIRMELIKES